VGYGMGINVPYLWPLWRIQQFWQVWEGRSFVLAISYIA